MKILMRGRIEQVDLKRMIHVISLSRVYTLVSIIDNSGQPVGTLGLKAGMVVMASSRDAAGLPALHELMRVANGDFQVAQVAPSPEMPAAPLGPAPEILMQLEAPLAPQLSSRAHAGSAPPEPITLPRLPAASPPGRDAPVVMRGSFADLELAGVLQVVSLSRQYTTVNVRDEQGAVTGAITLKAGMVLGAVAGHLQGVMGIVALMRRSERGGSFEVGRPAPPDTLPEPLGPLPQVLMRAIPLVAEPEDEERTDVGPGPNLDVLGPVHAASSAVVRASFRAPPGLSRPRAQARTPVVCVASAKGGVGKSTVALNASVALARAGLRVVLLDADPGGDLARNIGVADGGARGLLDAIAGAARPRDVILPSAEERLFVVPIGGLSLTPEQVELALSDAAAWSLLVATSAQDADVVLIDAPSGTTGFSRRCLSASTDVLAVLSAEPMALRSFEALRYTMRSLPAPPNLVGVVLNMWDSRSEVSALALAEAERILPEASLFEPILPRHIAFLEASQQGIPAIEAAPTLARLFEAIAESLATRLRLAPRAASHPA